MNRSLYYYKNGCTNCNGGKVELKESTFTYLCTSCGAFACAHRSNTSFAKKYEPYQYLASVEINSLRKSLEIVFNDIWLKKTRKRIRSEIREVAFINIIYTDNIRIYSNKELHHVKIIKHDKEHSICDVYSFDTENIIKNLPFQYISPITNRQKTYVWLSQELGLKPETCQIGYLTENQLKKAIEVCTKSLNEAKRSATKSLNNATGGA